MNEIKYLPDDTQCKFCYPRKKREKGVHRLVDSYHSLFPIVEKFTFLNHAATAPASLRVASALKDAAESFSRFGGLHYPRWMNKVREVRSLVARLINASPSEIAFTGNTSDGLSLVASAISWQPGDEVLITYPDFPANIYPWLNLERFGVKVSHIERKDDGSFSLDDIDKKMSPRLRLISVSSVDFSTGFHCNLRELGKFCRENGIFLCVDAIQSLGVIPMDVKEFGIDFLASGSHKWLQSIPGTGILYVSDDIAQRLVPSKIGWKSVVNEEDFTIHFDLKPNAQRFEPGTMNFAGIYALGAALELIFEVGIDNIRHRIHELNDLLYHGLIDRNLKVVSSMDEENRSGILSFLPGNDSEQLYQFFINNSVIVSLRAGKIRVSPHFYNNETDIQNFFSVLDEYLTTTRA